MNLSSLLKKKNYLLWCKLMSQISIIKKSELPNDKRIDAEYFKPEYIEMDKILSKRNTVSLITLSGVSDGNHLMIAEQYVQKGIRYLRAKDLSKYFVEDNEPVFIPEKFYDKLKRSHIKENDVLLSIVGTIGNVGIIKNPTKALTGNCKLAILRVNSIPPEFIYLFLISKFGQYQINRMIRGAVQQGLILPDLRTIKIITNTGIEDLIKKSVNNAHAKRANADLLYKEAEQKLLLKLGLDKLSLKHELTYISSLNKVESHQRFDAEYYQPIHEKLEEYLKNKCNAKPISELDFIDVTTGQYSEIYVECGKPYVRGTDLKNGTVNLANLVNIAESDQILDKIAKEGDVVVTRVGTIGLSSVIPKECDGGTISDNLIRLRFNSKQLNPFYLTLYLGSIAGQSLLIRNSRGSVQQRLNQETLKEVVIPLLAPEFQKDMASLIIKSHNEMKESLEIIENTKKALETYTITGNKSDAINILKHNKTD